MTCASTLPATLSEGQTAFASASKKSASVLYHQTEMLTALRSLPPPSRERGDFFMLM